MIPTVLESAPLVPEPKSGATTSEFWMGVIAQALVWWQVVDPSFRLTPGEHTKLTLAAGALSAIVTLYYARTRKQVKVAHQEAVAQVASSAGGYALPLAPIPTAEVVARSAPAPSGETMAKMAARTVKERRPDPNLTATRSRPARPKTTTRR